MANNADNKVHLFFLCKSIHLFILLIKYHLKKEIGNSLKSLKCKRNNSIIWKRATIVFFFLPSFFLCHDLKAAVFFDNLEHFYFVNRNVNEKDR